MQVNIQKGQNQDHKKKSRSEFFIFEWMPFIFLIYFIFSYFLSRLFFTSFLLFSSLRSLFSVVFFLFLCVVCFFADFLFSFWILFLFSFFLWNSKLENFSSNTEDSYDYRNKMILSILRKFIAECGFNENFWDTRGFKGVFVCWGNFWVEDLFFFLPFF